MSENPGIFPGKDEESSKVNSEWWVGGKESLIKLSHPTSTSTTKPKGHKGYTDLTDVKIKGREEALLLTERDTPIIKRKKKRKLLESNTKKRDKGCICR